MNTTMNATDAPLDDMFQRMGNLLKDIAATRTGLADDIAHNDHLKGIEPGVGEQLDLSA